jgi:hypothetical protein
MNQKRKEQSGGFPFFDNPDFILQEGKGVEEETQVHRIRITLTSRNVAPLEKVCH